MPRSLTASAPGKLILAGEHAVVYGRPALVAAVDLRLAATVAERPERRPRTVRIDVPRVGVAEEVSWARVRDYTRAARQRWDAWARGTAGAESFAVVRGADATQVVKVALGEAARFLGDETPPSLDLAIRSDLPLGSGFGSSAAAAVAVVAAYLAVRGAEPASSDLEAVAREVERRQHGLPSGVDAATVLHGGVLWAERGADGCLGVEPFPGCSPLLADLAVFDTGTPLEGTGAVVAAVRDRFARERGRLAAAWDAIEAATRALRALLEETAPAADDAARRAMTAEHRAAGAAGGRTAAAREGQGARAVLLEPEARKPAAVASLGAADFEVAAARRRLGELIRACQAGLEELGVVPAPVRELVRRIEGEGGAAKVSGAGALTGHAAGSLIVLHPEPERIAAWRFLDHLTRYPVSLGGPGLRIDRGSVSRPLPTRRR
jgi:mevalonate kinase